MVNGISGSSQYLGMTPVPENTQAPPLTPIQSPATSVPEQMERPEASRARPSLGVQAKMESRGRVPASADPARSSGMALNHDVMHEIAGHVSSPELMSLAQTGQALFDQFFEKAQKGKHTLQQAARDAFQWRRPAHERQAAATRFLNGIKSLREADDKAELLRCFAQQLGQIPDSDERTQSVRELYSLLAQMPLSKALARATQHTHINWLPEAERTKTFNAVLEIQERLVAHGFMPNTPANPLYSLRAQLKLLPANSQSVARSRLMAMGDKMAERGTPLRWP